jgi:predicted transcriptional regulator
MKTTRSKKVKFGELEDSVMQCVWDLTEVNGNLVDVKSIIKALNEKNPEKQYVYTTIHTTCLRLCKKNRLEKVQIKNKYFYQTAETKDMALKKDLQTLADKYFNGNLRDAILSLSKLEKR